MRRTLTMEQDEAVNKVLISKSGTKKDKNPLVLNKGFLVVKYEKTHYPVKSLSENFLTGAVTKNSNDPWKLFCPPKSSLNCMERSLSYEGSKEEITKKEELKKCIFGKAKVKSQNEFLSVKGEAKPQDYAKEIYSQKKPTSDFETCNSHSIQAYKYKIETTFKPEIISMYAKDFTCYSSILLNQIMLY